MKGRALIDIPHLGVRCGEYVELSEASGVACVADGSFDAKAEIPADVAARRVMVAEEDGLMTTHVGPAETAEASGGEPAAMTRKPRTKGSA